MLGVAAVLLTYLASFSHWLWTWSPELGLDERHLAWLHSPIRDPQSRLHPRHTYRQFGGTWFSALNFSRVFFFLFFLRLSVSISFLQHFWRVPQLSLGGSVRCYTLQITNNPTALHIALRDITVSEQVSPNRMRSNNQLTREGVFGKSAVIYSMHKD